MPFALVFSNSAAPHLNYRYPVGQLTLIDLKPITNSDDVNAQLLGILVIRLSLTLINHG
ncbi:hypothetical protein VCR12J2_620759 [Vibrio coralliirubri]|nr:hypothetical protein VCR12J2_620759 [Vibrio coralliirubri]